MTEPSSNPAETPPPPPPPPAYPSPPYQPETLPVYQPGSAPAYPLGFPGQPMAYPVSAIPASAMPVSAYPPVYVAPPPAAGVSPWIWVLAAVSAVLLITASGLGVAFMGAQNRISAMEQTVANVEDDLDEVRADLENAEADLEEAQACVEAFDAWWDAPVGADEDEWTATIDACQ